MKIFLLVCTLIASYIVISEANKAVEVPIIDFSRFLNGDLAQRQEVSKEIGKACEEVGFIVLSGHGIDNSIISNAWRDVHDFFDLSFEDKVKLEFPQHDYPFGYQRIGSEVLSAGKSTEGSGKVTIPRLPDAKEMFSLGPADPVAGFQERKFPSHPASFSHSVALYYDSLANLASKILQSFAMALDLSDPLFFEPYITHHASALRAINYPQLSESNASLPGLLRASAHTDYGMITILKADGPGLQVKKDSSLKQQQQQQQQQQHVVEVDQEVGSNHQVEQEAWEREEGWVDVPFVPDSFTINLGDLMKRWTNDKWVSTLHRVINPYNDLSPPSSGPCSSSSLNEACSSLSARRQSIAFFHNLNRDARVEALLTKEGEVAKYEPIIAGEFLMQKHLAATAAGEAMSPKDEL